ncbi:MAG TPA: hypothetical protein VMW24_09470 [Sedimentisphaerales bacterium]|nr:hypothetical protein [Sedimentisphaerales bacterium]
MKIQTALKSRTVWCGIIAALVAIWQLVFGDSAVLGDVEANKEVLASNVVLIFQGLLGVGAILFRIKAKNRT